MLKNTATLAGPNHAFETLVPHAKATPNTRASNVASRLPVNRPLQAMDSTSKANPQAHRWTQGKTVVSPFLGRPKAKITELEVMRSAAPHKGWKTAHEAARAFFSYYEADYQRTRSDQELVGLIVKTRDDRYFFTEAILTGSTFKETVRPKGPVKVHALLHTHPSTGGDQEGFSKIDALAAQRLKKDSYVRTPNGDIRYLNHRSIRGRVRHRINGKSICRHHRCLPRR